MSATTTNAINAIDLFSGIGGFSLAFHDVFDTVVYCEAHERCRNILTQAMARRDIDTAEIHDDVQTMSGAPLHRKFKPLVITAGFPCQDISVASQTRTGAKEGARSGLVTHVFRMCDEIPSIRVVILENSDNIVNQGYEWIAHEMRARGFSLHWSIYAASDVGALHLRRRWVCLAVRDKTNHHTQRVLEALSNAPRDRAKSWWSKWHNWETTSPPTLVSTPPMPSDATDMRWRCKLLGNSVVPCMITEAVRQLATSVMSGDIGKPVASFKSKRSFWDIIVHFDGVVTNKTYHHTQSQKHKRNLLPKNNVHILLRDWNPKTPPTVKTAFATPAFSHWSWHFYTQLSPRSTRVFQNQLLYMLTLKSEKHAESVRKTMIVNPVFVEYLMGFPSEYTQTPKSN